MNRALSLASFEGGSLGTASITYIGSIWNGSIDDVRIYNRVLSAAEIQAIYNATK